MKGLISPTRVSGLRTQMSPWGFFCLFVFCFSSKIFTYFSVLWVFVAACGLSLVPDIGGSSLVVCGLLTAGASLLVEHKL